jgi:1-acyl-sn-glycerol-3-phosphate acyltransferase
VVDVGLAARAATRLCRSTFASLSALGEARLSAHRTAREHADALAHLAGELLAIHGVEVDTVGVLPQRPCLLVANHVSHLDPLVILSQIPAVPVVSAEVAGWPVIGPAAAALGARFAGDPMQRARVLRSVLGALRTGVPVLNFPEGAIGSADRVERFARGGFGLAILAELQVVPIALAVDAPAGDGVWRLATRARTRVKMIVRAPMWGRPGEAPEDFAGRVRTAIALAIDPPSLGARVSRRSSTRRDHAAATNPAATNPGPSIFTLAG